MKSLPHNRLKVLTISLVVIVIAAIGAALLIFSHAATPYASVEVESGAAVGAATKQTGITAASGDSDVQFGSLTLSTSLGACTTSGATGAGTPTKTYAVGAPASGNSANEIQSQISAASSAGGGIVTLEAGTYTIDSTINMASNVELSGASESTTIIKLGTTNISIINSNGASNITLNNFTADASGNSYNDSNATLAYSVNIKDSTNAIVQNVETTNPFSYSIVPDDDTKFCIRDDHVQGIPDTTNKYNQLDGIHVEDSTEGDVVNNYVDNRYDNNTDGDDGLVGQSNNGNESYITYKGNVVRGGNDGDCMQFALGPDNISHDVVEDNEFWGCTYGIRTGGYGNSGSMTDSTFSDNNIHNIVPGTSSNGSFPSGGNAIDIGGYLDSGQSNSGNVVSDNYLCDAGSIVSQGGTTVSGTDNYTGCTDAPTTTTPPPTMP